MRHRPTYLCRLDKAGCLKVYQGFPDKLKWNAETLAETLQPGQFVHIKRYHPKSNIYGVPTYLSALSYAHLIRALTRTTTRFIEHGHLGSMISIAHNFRRDLLEQEQAGEDGKKSEKPLQWLNHRQQLFSAINAAAAGGQGRTVVVNFESSNANGEIDVNKVVKVDQFGKDLKELNHQQITQAYEKMIVAAHGIPGELMAAVFGDEPPAKLEDLAEVFARGTVLPITRTLSTMINRALPSNLAITFDPYELPLSKQTPG